MIPYPPEDLPKWIPWPREHAAQAPLTPERLADMRERNELAKLSVRDPGCPPAFLAPLTEYVDALLAEVERLRSLSLSLLKEWRDDEIQINSEWGNPRICDPKTYAEYERRKAELEGTR